MCVRMLGCVSVPVLSVCTVFVCFYVCFVYRYVCARRVGVCVRCTSLDLLRLLFFRFSFFCTLATVFGASSRGVSEVLFFASLL